jgi:lysophospholipase L1-like esterase
MIRYLLLASLLFVGANGAGAQTLKLDWRVANNFALLRGEAAQERFAREVAAFTDCIRREGNGWNCSPGQAADGLTRQRYPVRFDARRFAYERDLLRPTRGASTPGRSETDRVDVVVTVDDALADATCSWTLDGDVFRNQPCDRLAITARIDDPSKVSVSVDGREGLRGEIAIEIRRVIVLAMGDSFVAGEGNPHMRRIVSPLRGENWLEARCHRSLISAGTLALLRYAERHPKVYVAYLNLACSGSTVETGLLGRYGGVKEATELDNDRGPDDPVDFTRIAQLPSQIDQATAALCEGTGQARRCLAPDLVLLGIGVNDLGFGTIVRRLVGNTCGTGCLNELERRVDRALERLSGRGAGSLKKALDTIDQRIKPRNALLFAYPDPTRNDAGAPCNDSVISRGLGVGVIDARESQWASETMLVPLNTVLDQSVRGRPRWTFDGAAVAASATHGFCAGKTHFVSALQASIDVGTLHPNAAGHAAVAETIVDSLATIVNRRE